MASSRLCCCCGLCRLNCLPYPLRRRWHIDLLDAKRRERVNNGVDHRGWCADRSCLTAAFDPERIVRAWSLFRADLEIRQVVGARHAVVHVGSRYKLAALLVVNAVLQQRLT